MIATAVRQPRAVNSGPAAAKTFSLGDIVSKGNPLPNRYGMHAGVGFGKTSFATYTTKPIYLQTRGETGLDALIQSGQVPPTPHFPEIQSWAELTGAIKLLRAENHDYKTLVVDTANGAERLMHEFVCERDFDGNWTDKGFMGYMRGYEVALADWRLFLNSLDDLRKERGMTIFFLLHTRIKTFRNPTGADYDRYVPEMNEKTWGLTKGWLDCILFGNFEITVSGTGRSADPNRKGKAAETATRILYTNSDNPVFDAKNRMGLPSEIVLGDSAAEAWKNFAAALKEARRPAAESGKQEANAG